MGEATGPPPTGSNNGSRPNGNENAHPLSGSMEQSLLQPAQQLEAEDLNKGKEHTTTRPEEPKKAMSSTCKPIEAERPKIDLPSHGINAQIQYMKDHALIGKFISYWPAEKALQGWTTSKWKPTALKTESASSIEAPIFSIPQVYI